MQKRGLKQNDLELNNTPCFQVECCHCQANVESECRAWVNSRLVLTLRLVDNVSLIMGGFAVCIYLTCLTKYPLKYWKDITRNSSVNRRNYMQSIKFSKIYQLTLTQFCSTNINHQVIKKSSFMYKLKINPADFFLLSFLSLGLLFVRLSN